MIHKLLIASLALSMLACANSPTIAWVKDREVYVSPNGRHTIQLDKEFYTFVVRF